MTPFNPTTSEQQESDKWFVMQLSEERIRSIIAMEVEVVLLELVRCGYRMTAAQEQCVAEEITRYVLAHLNQAPDAPTLPLQIQHLVRSAIEQRITARCLPDKSPSKAVYKVHSWQHLCRRFLALWAAKS